MSRDFPDLVDIEVVVRNRREFSGSWPLVKMQRLASSLAAQEGQADFRVSFGRDPIGVDYARIEVRADLALECQRTLETFVLPVEREVTLGLIRGDDEEAGLPEGYEPFLVPDEPVRLTDLVEDELILALPLVPMSEKGLERQGFGSAEDAPEAETEPSNPFAALAEWRSDRND